MTSYMNITVRVVSAKALAQLRAVEAQMNRNTAATARGAAAGSRFGQGLTVAPLVRYGNQLQWVGRQLQYNFTLPILLAGAAATKFALDNEKAATRIKKVYGDLSMSTAQVNSETDALRKTFEALSNQYGVLQKDVLNIAADWAAAGSSGVALAKSVELTLKTMVLGEMEAADATRALIAIQAQYRFSTDQMIDTIAQLNIIENQTGVSLEGLIQAMERSAGVAKNAGIDIRHLGALIAALTPAAGTAAQAGNALKTIISRLLAPTKEANEVMAKMGINTKDVGWQSMTATQRIELMAKKFQGLSQAQKIVVSSTMATRFQINRFSTMMDEVNSKTGFYARALQATTDKQKYFKQATKELNMVLASNPQRLKQIWVMLQNGLATAITPLIPYILMAADAIAKLVHQFQKLSPEWQKAIALGLIFLALFGPLIRYLGSTMALIGVLGHYLIRFGRIFAFVGELALKAWYAMRLGLVMLRVWIIRFIPTLFGPWGILFAAIIALALIFHKQLAQVWDAIVKYALDAFYALPQGIQNAMMAVVRVVYKAVMAVYELLSYLNPFATHSPSLVSQVQDGMAEIVKQYSSIIRIKGPIKSAYADIKAFNKATAEFRREMTKASQAEDLAKILRVSPGAANEYKALVADLKELNRVLAQLQRAIDAQQAVVDNWTAKLKAANDAIKVQEKELDRLTKIADGYSEKLDEATARLDKYASAPIKGMHAMSDAIFENSQAQKQLQLAIMDTEDAAGGSIDELRAKYAALQGDIETATGIQTELRDAGAGSDITGFYDQQIAGLESQQQAIDDTLKPIQDMQNALDDLARQGERLDLQNSLQFDPLLRQIDELANGIEELPFDVIIAGVTQAKADVDKYTVALDAATKAVKEQQTVVDDLTTKRDNISDRLDNETAKLDVLQNKYNDVNAAIQAINSSLDQMTSLAEDKISQLEKAAADRKSAREASKAAAKAKAAKAQSPGAENFDAAAGGNFPIPGGKGVLGREGGPGDQTDLINQYTQGVADQTAKLLESFDVFAPLRKKWNEFTAWAQEKIDQFNTWWSNIKIDINTGPLGKAGDLIQSFWDKVKGIGEALQRMFGEDLGRIWEQLAQKAQKFIDTVGPELADTLNALKPLGDILVHLFKYVLWPVIEVVGAIVLGVLKVVVNLLSHTIGPILDGLIDLFADALKILRGFIEVILGILTGNFSQVGRGIRDIFQGIFEAIVHIVETFWSTLWGLLQSIWDGIVGIFTSLWDVLVGHSIIPDMIDDIIGYFEDLPGQLWNALKDLVSDVAGRFVDLATEIGSWYVDTATDLVNWFASLPGKAWNALKDLASKVIDKFTDTWNAWVTWRNNFYQNFWDWFSSLPGKAWDALVNLASKIKDRFTSLASTIHDWAFGPDGWIPRVVSWFSELPGKIWDSLLNLGEKVKDRFTSMGSAVRDWLTGPDGWFSKVVGWFADLPGKIWNGMKSGAQGLVNDFTSLFNLIGKAITGGVNVGIDAINGLISALNWVADKVPVLDFNIKGVSHLEYHPYAAPQLASGGVIPRSGVGGGFATNRARAIVGEGGAHPEFVIPTDPKYRSNAMDLMAQAQKTMGLKDAGGPWDFIKGVGSKLKSGAINLMFAPIKKTTEALISKIPKWTGMRTLSNFFLDQISEWMKGAEDHLTSEWMKPINSSINLGYGNTYSDGSFHSGIDFKAGIGTPVKAAGPGTLQASYDIPGTSPYNSYPYASYGRVIQIAHEEGISTLYAHLSERLFTQIGKDISAGDIIGKSGTMGNSTGPHLHFEVRRNGTPINPIPFLNSHGVSMDSGGWLKPGTSTISNRTGGAEPVFSATQWAVLERSTRVSMDLVATLPNALKSAVATATDRAVTIAGARADQRAAQSTTTANTGRGDLIININGNLEFPNISSGSDADEFIRNLESLAG